MSTEQLPEEKNGDWVDLKKEDLSCTLPTHPPSTVTPSTLTENSTQEENTENSEEEPTEKSTEEENPNLATLSTTEDATIENLKIAEKTPSEPTESTPVEPSDAVVPAAVKTEEQTLKKEEEEKVPPTMTEEQTLEKGEEEKVPATLTEEQTLEVKDVEEDVPATTIEEEQTLDEPANIEEHTLDEPETLLRERRTKDSVETSTAENIDDEESTTPQANPVDKVANFFLTPGITSSAVVIMNASFAGLFLSLFVLLAMTHSYHVVFLIFTTAGLFISTHWFMMELKAAKAREAISISSETSACEVSAILDRTKEQIQSESTLNVNETRAKQA